MVKLVCECCFFFKQKTAYEMRISDLSSDVCSSDLVRVEGEVGPGVSAKDIILHITGAIGAAGGTGHVIEYTGSAIRALSIEGRLRSEERRGGKECVSPCRYRGSPYL